MGRGDVDGAVEIFAGDEEFDGAGKVGFVNPGDELAAVALRAAEAQRTRLERTAKALPGAGLKTWPQRMATLRVRGVAVSKNADSQSLATRMEKFQVSGAPASESVRCRRVRRSPHPWGGRGRDDRWWPWMR